METKGGRTRGGRAKGHLGLVEHSGLPLVFCRNRTSRNQFNLPLNWLRILWHCEDEGTRWGLDEFNLVNLKTRMLRPTHADLHGAGRLPTRQASSHTHTHASPKPFAFWSAVRGTFTDSPCGGGRVGRAPGNRPLLALRISQHSLSDGVDRGGSPVGAAPTRGFGSTCLALHQARPTRGSTKHASATLLVGRAGRWF